MSSSRNGTSCAGCASAHPAGSLSPTLQTSADGKSAAGVFRNVFEGATVESQKKNGFGDPVKGIQKVYELSKLPNPPLRLLLGKDINKYVRQYIAQLTKEADEYAAWSDNLGYI